MFYVHKNINNTRKRNIYDQLKYSCVDMTIINVPKR